MTRTQEQRDHDHELRQQRHAKRAVAVKARLRDIYSSARHFKVNHARLMEYLATWRASVDYARLTTYDRARIEGYADALYDDINANHLEWRLTLPDGTWIDSREYPYSTVKCTSYDMLGNHFWRGTDKPYGEPAHMNREYEHAPE